MGNAEEWGSGVWKCSEMWGPWSKGEGVRVQARGRCLGKGTPGDSGPPLLLLPEVAKHLTMAELTDLIWTAIDGLGYPSPFRVQAAASMLPAVAQEHGAKPKTVRGLGTR